MFGATGADVNNLIKNLVKNLTGFEDSSTVFHHCEKYIKSNLETADSMFFLTKKGIDSQITGQVEKFRFHGFKDQGDKLRKAYDRFIPHNVSRSDLDQKLIITKFLICLSESPTKNFLENPDVNLPGEAIEEEQPIDWGLLLKDDLWNPCYSSSSSSDDLSDESLISNIDTPETTQIKSESLKSKPEVTDDGPFVNVDDLRKNLQDNFQHGWFNGKVQEIPESEHPEANIAFSWDRYVEERTNGLFNPSTNVITEYKVMREVIWEFWVPNTCASFIFDGKEVIPRENISISSVRSETFTQFLHEFTQWINLVQYFRNFNDTFNDKTACEYDPPGIYETYHYYAKEIIDFHVEKTLQIENEIRKQESGMTLLKLAKKLRDLFKNVVTLKRIHEEVIIDFKTNPPLKCATTLLMRLREGLTYNISSQEDFNIYLTLYVGSLFRYIQIVWLWFYLGDLKDSTREFIIGKKSGSSQFESNSNCIFQLDVVNDSSNIFDCDDYFYIRKVEPAVLEDKFFKIIITKVMEIGKSLRYIAALKMLGRLESDLTSDIYEEFQKRLLEKISNYFHVKFETDLSEPENADTLKDTATCPDFVKYPIELDRLEHHVNTSNPFLMRAFRKFLVKVKPVKTPLRKTLFEKIADVSKSLFPAERFIDEMFNEILDERFGEIGGFLINLFKTEYRIYEHFDLLGHLYLFKNNTIGPWYRQLFNQIDESSRMDHATFLTGSLHDTINDIFPELYKRCQVKVNAEATIRGTPIQNSLNACKLLRIEYNNEWPIDMVIDNDELEMYQEVFEFVLQIKWGLYTLTHLSFTDIESNIQGKNLPKSITFFLRRIKACRFWLITQFTSLQYYVLTNILSSGYENFRNNVNKSTHLHRLSAAHKTFVNEIHTSTMHLKNYNIKAYGFNYLLYLVDKLKSMWNDLGSVDMRELSKLEKGYKVCNENLEVAMNLVSERLFN